MIDNRHPMIPYDNPEADRWRDHYSDLEAIRREQMYDLKKDKIRLASMVVFLLNNIDLEILSQKELTVLIKVSEEYKDKLINPFEEPSVDQSNS